MKNPDLRKKRRVIDSRKMKNYIRRRVIVSGNRFTTVEITMETLAELGYVFHGGKITQLPVKIEFGKLVVEE